VSQTDTNTALLEMRSIRKRFGEAVVLDGVDLDVHAGEVHALAGENGAGKSTLMRIAAGIHAPDGGEITFCGREFAPKSPAHALRAGIAMAHQELSLAGDLSVAENILAGLEPRWGGFVDWKRLYQRAREMLAEFCPAIDAYAPVSSLGMGYRQVVEILKALAWEPKVIIFDEPTSALEVHEAELVLETIRKLKAKSVGVVYISHRMDEVFHISDRITVLRDGKRVGSWRSEDISPPAVLHAMVGRDLNQLYPTKAEQFGEVLFSVEGFTRRDHFQDISFALRRREILGFSGLVGAGRTELMRAIFRADAPDAGRITLEGKPRRFRSIRDAVQAGIAYVPEDRKTQGLFLDQTVEENILCGNRERFLRSRARRCQQWIEGSILCGKLNQCSQGGIVGRCLCRELGSYLKIIGWDPAQEIRNLSGGNQQKALLARWLATAPKVLIVDEPTRGIDVGAKAEIHRLLREYADAGNGVIVVSSEMPELLGLCDRILVLHEGALAGEADGRTATEQELIHLATGSSLSN
jgi:inositol transport system ATP-binding protein